MATQEQAQPHGGKHEQVEAIVDYLPATEDFTEEYRARPWSRRSDGREELFGVQDRQERDKYFYYLVFRGERIQNTQVTPRAARRRARAEGSLRSSRITAGGTTK